MTLVHVLKVIELPLEQSVHYTEPHTCVFDII